jgi:hypothetical protein
MPHSLLADRSFRTKFVIGLGLAGALLAYTGKEPSNAASQDGDVAQEAAVEKLMYCYARGTDAIGRGDVAGGKNVYHSCFTNNAELSAYFPGMDFAGPFAFATTSTDAWADFVSAVFSGNGYTATQHLVGNVEAHVIGNHGTMTSYVHATHVLPDGSIAVANGTFEDEVVRQQGQWRISRHTVKLITFLNLATTP